MFPQLAKAIDNRKTALERAWRTKRRTVAADDASLGIIVPGGGPVIVVVRTRKVLAISFKARLDVFRLDSNGNVVPLNLECARHIVADLVDPTEAGSLVDTEPQLLGRFDGEPAYIDRRGVLIVNVGFQDTTRIFAALCCLVKHFQVDVWLGDSDQCWTDRVCAVQSTPH